jgi:hypothetical protein
VDPSADLTCGDGVALPKPGGTPTVQATPSDTPSESPSASPSVSDSASASASATPGTTPTKTKTPGPTRTTAGPPPPTTTTAPPPRDTTKPTVRLTFSTQQNYIYPPGCKYGGPATVPLTVYAVDSFDPTQSLKVSISATVGSGSAKYNGDGKTFSASYGGVSLRANTTIVVTATATDPAGNAGSATISVIYYSQCIVG